MNTNGWFVNYQNFSMNSNDNWCIQFLHTIHHLPGRICGTSYLCTEAHGLRSRLMIHDPEVERGPTLTYRTLEQSPGHGAYHMEMRTDSSSRFTKHGDLIRIATKVFDIFFNESQRHGLIFQCHVSSYDAVSCAEKSHCGQSVGRHKLDTGMIDTICWIAYL